jgi:hypothetical protein
MSTLAPFGCADKLAEKHCWLICCERKILFQLKKQTKKMNYKSDEQGRWRSKWVLMLYR